jgi:hypothetical protein
MMCHRRRVALAAHGAGVGVFHFAPAFLQLLYALVDALQDIQRLEAGDHDGHAVFFGQRAVLLDAHDHAHVAGGQKTLHPALGRLHEGLDGGRHQHVGDQHGEIGQPLLGLVDGHGVGGRGGFEADGEEHHFAGRVLPGQFHRVQRGVYDAHVVAGGLD